MQPGGTRHVGAARPGAADAAAVDGGPGALANAEVHGQAGGGLVQVTMKGSGEVVAVSIDPKVVDPDDVETLQDLIVGAMADAAGR